MEEEDFSFNSWLFSKQEILEKTVGLAILFLEIINHIQEIYGLGREELTTILNLFFLLFIFFILKRDLPHRYSLKENEHALERILRLSRSANIKEKLDELIKIRIPSYPS